MSRLSAQSGHAAEINDISDQTSNQHWVNLLPGEVYVTKKEETIRTVLGSCVAVCLRDPVANVAGMNHFLLPRKKDHSPKSSADTGAQQSKKAMGTQTNENGLVFSLDASESARYGNWAMELLINEMLKNGANKKRFECKIFGGANVIKGMTRFNIGQTNVEFVVDFLAIEGIAITNRDTGTEYPRKILFDTKSGRVEVQKMSSQAREIFAEENKLANKVGNTQKDDLDDGIDFF